MTNELAETTVQRDEWKRIAEDRGIELERLRADISQAYDLRDKAEGRYCTALGAIEQLHAAVKTAQELAATRLMEIERLSKREKTLMDVIDSRDRALGFVPLDDALHPGPSISKAFANSPRRVSHEPLPCADPGWEIREGKATCKGCGKTAEQVFGASRDAPSESQKMMAAGYASRRIPREDFSKGASRDADHCDYPDCEQHWTHVVAQARALLEPLAEHDPAIRQWLKTPDLPSLGASRDASSADLIKSGEIGSYTGWADVSEKSPGASRDASSEPCEHLRSEFLVQKLSAQPPFEMRKCLDCTKIFRKRLMVADSDGYIAGHSD